VSTREEVEQQQEGNDDSAFLSGGDRSPFVPLETVLSCDRCSV